MSELILSERLAVMSAVGISICNCPRRFKAIDFRSRTPVSPWSRVLLKCMLSRQSHWKHINILMQSSQCSLPILIPTVHHIVVSICALNDHPIHMTMSPASRRCQTLATLQTAHLAGKP